MTYLKGAIARTALLALLTVGSAPAFAQESTKLLRQPDIGKDNIVFVYGGDLWLVPRPPSPEGGIGGSGVNGGGGGVGIDRQRSIARRLTANPSVKRFPKFSPDGRWIAFTGNYDGNSDVYLIPASGGEPKRLTYHPGADLVLGWTPDSRAVLFRSSRFAHSQRVQQLFTVPVTGGMETKLPIPEAGLAWFAPDGKRLAYNRISREGATWKRYRGGLQSYISIYDPTSNAYSELPHTDTTDFYPMWHGDKIYFASDRTNTVNLFCYDLKSKSTKQLTRYSDYDVKWPSLGPDAIVFEQAGALNVLDLNSEKVSPLTVTAASDNTLVRPSWRHVEDNIGSFGLSPSGARAVFEARGDVFTVPAKKGESRDLTNTSGVREINPAWSPDGKWIAYLSDKSGEYELYIRAQDGTGTETRLTTDGNVYRTGPVWSPDSKALLYGDVAMRLWMITVADKKPILVDSTKNGQLGLGRWSPDSKWIAYALPNTNNTRSLMLYSVAQQKATKVTDGWFDDREPVFDLNGKYLYFASDRTFNPTVLSPEININLQNTTSLFMLALSADTASPFGPESDEEKPAPTPDPSPKNSGGEEKPGAPKPDAAKPAAKPDTGTKIDLEGLGQRIIALPLPPGNYNNLNGGTNKLFYTANGALFQFDLNSRNAAPIVAGIQNYDINANGSKIIYQAPGNTFGIIDAAPGQAVGAGRLNLALEMRVEPRAEWKQMYQEAWRLERDFYYDPNMRGLDWKAIGERYGKLVPDIAHRDDLSYLLGELIGELNTSHAYVQQGELPPVKQVNVGLLGVDFEPGPGGYYRIKKIYRGENWDPARRSPLTEPGIKVKAGDYLIAVNGVPLKTDTNPYAPFEGLAGKTVTLKVNDKEAEAGAREVQVKPVGSEAGLRYYDWVEANRKKVEMATGGRVGYIHVPDTATEGMTEFAKAFYALTDKDALIVDERFNSGGFIPDFFAEKLGRKLLSIATPRYGQDFRSPGGAVYGPKIILANEWSGSGGDAFPYYFRKYGIGPILGKRTWGGLVGINGGLPLLDGGAVTVPQFGIWSPQDNKWIAENHGVDPDIEVNNTPDKMREGGDPQLERAIAWIQEQLKKNPPPKYQHPPFPIERLQKAGK